MPGQKTVSKKSLHNPSFRKDPIRAGPVDPFVPITTLARHAKWTNKLEMGEGGAAVNLTACSGSVVWAKIASVKPIEIR